MFVSKTAAPAGGVYLEEHGEYDKLSGQFLSTLPAGTRMNSLYNRFRFRLSVVALGLTGALTLTGTHAAGQNQVAPQYYHYRGAVHIHTQYSDGSGTFPQVVEAARAAGLSYIIVTDHNTLEPLKDGHQRYWGDLLVLVGTEISTDAGHVLALDLPESFSFETDQAQQVIDRVSAAGGFTLLAHPMAPRWLWQDWSVKGYAGMEIINLASLVDDDLMAAQHGLRLQDRSVRRLLQLAQRYASNPDSVMKTLTNNDVERERKQWDRLLASGRQIVGIGGVDAHERVPLAGRVLRVPTYGESFESVSTYAITPQALTGNLETDRRLIYDAYRNGRVYAVYPRVAPAPGFRFTATEGARQAIMGQPLRLEQRARFQVEAPDHPRPIIRLLRNGQEVTVAEGQRLEWTVTTPGAYRIEVYAQENPPSRLERLRRGQVRRLSDLLKNPAATIRPWIFSNPIYVR